MGPDLCKMVEESRRFGNVSKAINATYIALIQKGPKPKTLFDFRPISMCNLVCKIISKVISNMIKQILADKMSLNQFGFLADRQIHDAIGIAQEILHSIK